MYFEISCSNLLFHCKGNESVFTLVIHYRGSLVPKLSIIIVVHCQVELETASFLRWSINTCKLTSSVKIGAPAPSCVSVSVCVCVCVWVV